MFVPKSKLQTDYFIVLVVQSVHCKMKVNRKITWTEISPGDAGILGQEI